MKRRDKIIIIFSFCALALLSFRSVSAQNTDIIAPSMVYRPSTVATHVGQALQVQALITDNEAIKEVVLFYRPTGKEGYISLAMTLQAGGSNLYSAGIPQEFVIEPRIEFYIQATDTSGNTTAQGSSSSPLQVTVFPPTDPKPMPVKPFYKKAWFWSAVALVSGAVALENGEWFWGAVALGSGAVALRQEKDTSGPASGTNTNARSMTFTAPAP